MAVVAPTAAFALATGAGGSTVAVGFVYFWPIFVTMTEVTEPAVSTVVALAPTPVDGSLIVMSGGVVYPLPPFATPMLWMPPIEV